MSEAHAIELSSATSIDGRAFFYVTDFASLDFATGGYVALDDDDGPRLGQVTGIELASSRGPDGEVLIAVSGRIVDGPVTAFHGAVVTPAAADRVEGWLERIRPGRASLEVGTLSAAPGVPLALDAGAFARHTFLCGQSGSGKTYALGTILERLLAETSLRIVILDPNSDFVRLGEPRDGAPPEFGRAAADVVVRTRGEGHERLHVRFRDFSDAEMAATLRLDPIVDRAEYAALLDLLADEELARAGSRSGIVGVVQAMLESTDAVARGVGMRARNLGLDRWPIWSASDPGSLQDLLAPGGPRCLVVDLGSLATPGEQAVVAEAVLGAIWRRRAAREPTLVVIDEAHNVCPSATEDPLVELATEHAVKIAAEGRKFGLTLLVSTQRPQKVHENVVSQCDNLALMRLNSRSDLAALSELFSFVPNSLLALATEFGQGEALVAGKLVASPTLARIGPRWSQEGGADPPSDWAASR